MSNVTMLDLETMGTNSAAAIVAIGAVAFDPEALTLGDEFYMVVDLDSVIKSGGVVDAGTVMWWLKQSDEARAALASGKPISSGLMTLTTFIGKHCDRDARVWGNGSDFDNVILGSAYDRCGIVRPWKFFNSRCYRTLKNLYPDVEVPKRTGTHHNALDDARFQSQHALKIFEAFA